MVEEKHASCCYALSDKYWVTDPAGIAWETFHSLGQIPLYGPAPATDGDPAAACCAPGSGAKAKAGCCA